MGAVLSMAVRLESETCITCGIEFALPEGRMRWLRDHPGTGYFCPNGHEQHFIGKTEAQKLQEQLATKERELQFQRTQRDAAERQASQAIARANSAEKKLRRAKNGVCPCCKRSFTALRRHMTSKHPEWKP